MSDIVITPDPADVPRQAALRIARSLSSAIREREWAFLALSGGPLIRATCEELVPLQVPWERVEFFFTDERCVPASHPASNFGVAQDILLTNRRIDAHQLHRIEVDLVDRQFAIERHEEELPDAFDLMLFELGLDGHIGALFPASPAFDEPERLVVTVTSPQKPRDRIALVPRALELAAELVVLATGRDRAPIVARALHGPLDPRAVPAQLARNGTWILDRSASSMLRS